MKDVTSGFGQFWFATQKLVSLMERNVARRLRADLGIGSMQYRVLSAVQIQEAGFNQRDVAAMLGTTAATVSRQIEAASTDGYLTVELSSDSRREHVVRLTKAGAELVAAGDAIIGEESEVVLAGVDSEMFDITSRTVAAMLRALDGEGFVPD